MEPLSSQDTYKPSIRKQELLVQYRTVVSVGFIDLVVGRLKTCEGGCQVRASYDGRTSPFGASLSDYRGINETIDRERNVRSGIR